MCIYGLLIRLAIDLHHPKLDTTCAGVYGMGMLAMWLDPKDTSNGRPLTLKLWFRVGALLDPRLWFGITFVFDSFMLVISRLFYVRCFYFCRTQCKQQIARRGYNCCCHEKSWSVSLGFHCSTVRCTIIHHRHPDLHHPKLDTTCAGVYGMDMLAM